MCSLLLSFRPCVCPASLAPNVCSEDHFPSLHEKEKATFRAVQIRGRERWYKVGAKCCKSGEIRTRIKKGIEWPGESAVKRITVGYFTLQYKQEAFILQSNESIRILYNYYHNDCLLIYTFSVFAGMWHLANRAYCSLGMYSLGNYPAVYFESYLRLLFYFGIVVNFPIEEFSGYTVNRDADCNLRHVLCCHFCTIIQFISNFKALNANRNYAIVSNSKPWRWKLWRISDGYSITPLGEMDR